MDSPFDVLRVDPEASEEELRQAYRQRAKETHPDQGGSAAEFQLVKTAYDEIRSGHWSNRSLEAGDSTDAEPEGNRTGGTGDNENGAESPEDEVNEAISRVEFIDYEVIVDQGWDLGDADLFEKAAGADLPDEDYGQLFVQAGESILEAAESRGFAWPYACRGGACANCAIVVLDGELEMPHDTILPREMIDSGIRLSCNGVPITDEMRIIYNAKHLPGLEDLRLPPRPFDQAYAGD